MSEQPIIAITMGDPCGIGPEIVVKSLAEVSSDHGSRFVVLGCPQVIAEMVDLCGVKLTVGTIPSIEAAVVSMREIQVLETTRFGPVRERFGSECAEGGRAALVTIERAAEMARDGLIAGCATAPVSKVSLKLAGSLVPGHAELFAASAGVERVFALLCHEEFRVVHLSTHVSLRAACDLVRKERIVEVTRATAATLVEMGIARPRIALAALNPHGGDSGMFGTEEQDEIAPAADVLRASGLDVAGPIPADIVYPQARCGVWDCVVAMYHDQGHIPIKTASFEYDSKQGRWVSTGGVTLTVGLPFPRTSVDHGTAFDIAGRGIAGHQAMAGAIELAARLGARGNH